MKRKRGYALPVILLTLGIIAAFIVAFSSTLLATMDVGSRSLGLHRAAAATDGALRVLIDESQRRFRDDPGLTPSALETALCTGGGGCGSSKLPSYAIAPIVFETFAVQPGPLPVGADAPIGAGPFSSLRGQKRSYSLRLLARDQNKSVALKSRVDLLFASVSATAFMGVSPLSATVAPATPHTLAAPVHSNGDLCVGGAAALDVTAVTSAAQLRHGDSAPCSAGSAPVGVLDIATTLTSASDSTAADWIAATARFRDKVLDATHGVPELRLLPELGAPAMHGGATNVGSWRSLVDPPAAASESAALRALRLAHLADVRIVNGVWYLRDPAVPGRFPGNPIWSDHPGTRTIDSGTSEGALHVDGAPFAVGQRDLFGTGPRPALYSYYEADDSGTLSGALDGAVSYGALTEVGGRYVPARGASNTAASGASDLLRGTRAGYRDRHLQDGGDPLRGNVLPINIDVEALLLAAADTSSGELGDAIAVAGLGSFNGIVFITNTWQDALLEPPALPPTQGARTNLVAQPAPAAGEQEALPAPLCAASAVPLGATGFTAPTCASFADGGARPSVVRLVNAADLSARPAGLTIATNLDMVVLGDVNTVDVGGVRPAVLLAADHLTVLSASWRDAATAFGSAVGAGPVPTTTTVRASVLVGTRAEGGAVGFERVAYALEDWTSAGPEFRLTGSVVLGFASVHRRAAPATGPSLPRLAWSFDADRASPLAQPPGTPRVALGRAVHFMR